MRPSGQGRIGAHNRKFMSFTGRKVLMAPHTPLPLPPAYIQFLAGDGRLLFCNRPTGHIGIFSLVMAITSDKGGHLYENHPAHRCCHKVKKEPISSSSCNSFWLSWGKGVAIVTPVMTSTALATGSGPHWSTLVHSLAWQWHPQEDPR